MATPPSADILINRALAIEEEDARSAGALGFMARAMVMATLPHSKVEGNEFVRKNGNYTLTLLAPSAIGLPYGSVPRLLLAWLTTEAVRTKSPDLLLGDSLSYFMRELEMTPTGGRWGSITRLKEQTRRLFNSTVTASYEDDRTIADRGYRLTEKSVLWWDSPEPKQAGLWLSTVTLSDQFYREVIDRPVPIDMRAIKALKRSPMALDIYTWLTYRMSYLKRPTVIPWEGVAMMLGSGYAGIRFFKRAFLVELKKVLLVYPAVDVEALDDGLMIRPSKTHIPKKMDIDA